MDLAVRGFFFVVLIVLIIILAPVLLIWALNTLFPVLVIPYTIKTWFAALVIGSVLSRAASQKSSK